MDCGHIDLGLLRSLFKELSFKERTYSVQNLYFDTPELKNLHDKISGSRQKTKYRVRKYDNHTSLFFEKKMKNGNIVYKKQKQIHSIEDISVGLLNDQGLIPVYANNYHRLAWESSKLMIKVNIDTNTIHRNLIKQIKFCDPLPVIELKFFNDGNRYDYFDKLLTDLTLKRTTFSKYERGMSHG